MLKKQAKPYRIYPFANETVEFISNKRLAKIVSVSPIIIMVRWDDTGGVEEFARDYFVDKYWKIVHRNYNIF